MSIVPAISVGDPMGEQPSTGDFVLPPGTVSFLLTDVEGSVRLGEADPDWAHAAFTKLADLIADAVGAHNGALVRAQGEGDSSLSAFSRATDAIAAALAVQTQAMSEWEGRIKLRAAIHTGEAVFHRAGQYFGRTVNRCARIRDAAHGGQVLVSSATRDLAMHHLPNGCVLQDLGMHQLRDLDAPEPLWQLAHPALPSSFPPLRTLDVLPNNLPRHLTSFVGRTEDVARVVQLVRESRLATLTGPGGVGKTRLSLQAAASVLDGFRDGVWFVDLSALEGPTGVGDAALAALGLRDRSDGEPEAALARWISARELLLILDNCEHVVEEAATFTARLLGACPALRVLTTSREPLQLPGEIAWTVPSMSTPPITEDLSIEALNESDAVRLFVERATRSRPNFQLTDDNAATVVEICRRLDGIPLAIELAAARCRVLGVDAIRAGLADRFRLIAGTARTVMPRQQTLRASVDWSYALLSEPERLVLQRLSAFVTSFTLDEAEAVCEGDGVDVLAVLDLLTALVDRSLVVALAEHTPTRYRLLDTIQAYAHEKLGDDAARLRARFVEVYAELSARANQGWYFEQDRWLRWATHELPNIKTAIGIAQAIGSDAAVSIPAHAWPYFWLLSERRVILPLVEQGLASTTDASVRCDLEEAMAYLNLGHGAHIAHAHAEAALALAREIKDRFREAMVLRIAGPAKIWNGRAEQGFADMKLALEILDTLDDPRVPYARSAALANLGMENLNRRHLDEAEHLFQQAHDTVRAAGIITFGAVLDAFHSACIRIARGDLDEALVMLDDSLRVADTLGVTWPKGFSYAVRSEIMLARADIDDAVADIDAAVGYAEKQGIEAAQLLLARKQALLGDAAGGLARARPFASIDTYGTIPPPVEIAAIAFMAGEFAEARSVLASIDRSADLGRAFTEELVTFVHAMCVLLEGDHEEATRALVSVLEPMAADPDPTAVARPIEGLAMAACAREDWQRALRLHGAATTIRGYNRTLAEFWMHARYDAAIADATHALGAEEASTAVAEGAAMSRQEAITLAGKGRGARKRPSSGWAALTPVELQVVRLVREGLPNPQIAERLFLSRRTVESHVSSALRKLGVASRVDLATEATRREPSTEVP